MRDKLRLYLDLIRWDRPAGWLLLLWPSLSALWIAAGGFPGWHLLAVFTLAASYFFHGYWRLPADQQFMQQLLFFKNIAVTGGLLTLAAWGAGAWSFDARSNAVPAAKGGLSLAA